MWATIIIQHQLFSTHFHSMLIPISREIIWIILIVYLEYQCGD